MSETSGGLGALLLPLLFQKLLAADLHTAWAMSCETAAPQ
jgi:hypothetical protein